MARKEMADCSKKTGIKRCPAGLGALIVLLLMCMILASCGHSGKGSGKEENPGTEAEGGKGQKGEESESGNGAEAGNESEYSNESEYGSGAESGQAEGGGKETGNAQSVKGSGGSKENSEQEKNIIKEPLHVGDSLQDGDLEITYLSSGEYHEESEYLQPEAGYKYIFLEFAFRNTGSKYDCPISLFSFNCFADNYTAQAYYGGEKELASSLSPGRLTQGCFYFSVPEDAAEIEAEYQPSYLSQSRIRFAYEGEKDAGMELQRDSRRTDGAFEIGDCAASALQKITYLSCEKDDSDNEFIRPEDGCTFYTLTLEFENLQKEERQVSIYDFSCYADGISCSKSLFRSDYLSASVLGGRKAKGTVTFEVPDDAQTVEVEYDTGSLSAGHVVFTVR